MIYRREIDGLRAIAVLPVILFHAGFETFGGGFVGVDVFFVISGYLITSILIGDLKEGRFSLVRFYERRARRILPALFLVVLSCIPFAVAWMSPSQLRDFGESVVAVVFFGSNILFWREDGYFEAAAELKPLLHTWSLAVEEQFYLLFPLLLLALWQWARSAMIWVIAACALASLALCEWALRNGNISDAAVFYLAPTRAWELFAGSLCAFALSNRAPWRNDILGLGGLILIFSGIFLFDKTTPFPSLYALLPVGGTVLVILFAGGGTICARALSLPLLVGVGLVSYSAYLWHQPLFAFARLRSLFEPSDLMMLALSAASLGLAYLSWRFVEAPFRRAGSPFMATRKRLFIASGAAGAAVAAVGVVAIASEDWLSQGPKAQFAELEQRTLVNRGLSRRCNGFEEREDCRTSTEPKILVWGDSYAMHIVPGLVASDPGIRLQQFTKSACTPVMIPSDHELIERGLETSACSEFNSAVISWLERNETVDIVIVSSPFSIAAQYPENALGLFRETIHYLQDAGKKVIIFSPTPFGGYDIGQCSTKSIRRELDETTCDFESSRTEARRASFDLLVGLSEIVPVIWLDEMICPSGICDVIQDGVLIFRDRGHLSSEGSEYLGQKFDWAELARSATIED